MTQPAPTPNDQPAVVDVLIADLEARRALGVARYGVPLQAGNGRDMHVDAYEEVLDALIYVAGCLIELRRAVAATTTAGDVAPGRVAGRGIPGVVHHPPGYWRCTEPRCRGWLIERAGGRHLHPPGPVPAWLLTEPADTALPIPNEETS